jgi:2-keto-4-pentenoate hydratase
MTRIENIDMRLTGMTIEKSGVLVGSGTTAEVWGNPAASVAWLANKLSQFGMALEAGQIVMSGAVTACLSRRSYAG